MLRGQFSLVIKRELGVLWGQVWTLVPALPLTCVSLGKCLRFSECSLLHFGRLNGGDGNNTLLM